MNLKSAADPSALQNAPQHRLKAVQWLSHILSAMAEPWGRLAKVHMTFKGLSSTEGHNQTWSCNLAYEYSELSMTPFSGTAARTPIHRCTSSLHPRCSNWRQGTWIMNATCPGLDSPGRTHGDDFLVPAWPKAVPGLPWHLPFELVLGITLPRVGPGQGWHNPPLSDQFMRQFWQIHEACPALHPPQCVIERQKPRAHQARSTGGG